MTKRRGLLSVSSATLVAVLLWFVASHAGPREASGDQRKVTEGSVVTAGVASTTDADPEVNLPEQCVGVALDKPQYLPTVVLPVPELSCGSHNVLMVFRLVGEANADTFPASGGLTDESQHPASVLSYAVTDNPSNSLPDAIDLEFFEVRTVSLKNGGTARVATPVSGYGPYRIDWVMSGKLFTLLGSRGSTDKGDSGLPMDELIKIAESVPSPQV